MDWTFCQNGFRPGFPMAGLRLVEAGSPLAGDSVRISGENARDGAVSAMSLGFAARLGAEDDPALQFEIGRVSSIETTSPSL